MNDFIFQNPTKVRFGRDQLRYLPEELGRFGKNVLLVYGGGSIKKSGLYDRIKGLLEPEGFRIHELSGVEPNPRHTTVNRGAKLCRDNHVDVILAVGGGSTIDCSKGVAALTFAATDDVWDIIEGRVPYERALPLVAVLTLAATGSEMDSGAVISNMDKNLKSGLFGVRPSVSFELPELTFSVSPFQTACGSFDIMSHLFDVSYFTLQPQLEMVEGMQEQLLRTVVKFAPIAIREPDNYEARANLMWASSWGLNDFLACGVRQAATCHMIEHQLSAYYDITHGLGLAILTPRWLAYVLSEVTAPRIARFGRNVMGITTTGDVMEDAKKAIAALEDFCFGALGLTSRLSELGIGREKFEVMAEGACFGGRLPGFTELTKDDVVKIYEMCL